MYKLVIIFLISIFQLGCIQKTKQQQYDNNLEEEKGVPIHGNFCGKDIPNIEEQDKQKRIEILKSIKPIDEIDNICKKHDICYIQFGRNNASCDNDIVENTRKIYDKLNKEDEQCKWLTVSITFAFISKSFYFTQTVWKGTKNNQVNRLFYTPFGLLIDLYSGVVYGAGALSVGVLRKLSGKEKPLSFPERYRKCEIN